MSFIKEILGLVRHGKWRELFLAPTNSGGIQFFRYLFVGGIATVVDWILSFLGEWSFSSFTGLHTQIVYIIATTLGFAGGLTVNFLLSRAFVFGAKQARAKTKAGEFFGHLTVGALGLGMSYLIVWVGTSFLLKDNYMVFRIIATIIVFFWNYLARKFFVYKE